MPHFICFRCNYETNHKASMYIHLTKNIKCSRNIESLKYSDDEITKYSLINSNDKYNFNYNFKISKNTKDFIEELKDVYNSKRRICNYCQIKFNKFKELENHLFECIEIINDSKNNTNNNLLNNNLNINNDILYDKKLNNPQTIIPFNEKWITTHINNSTKTLLFLSKSKFSKTLENILENNINKNIFLDKNQENIYVYKNINEKFKKYKTNDIIDDIMKKLYNHLLDFHDDIKKNNFFQIDNDILKESLKNIKNKFIIFKKNNEIKKNVYLLLISIIIKYKNNIVTSNNNILTSNNNNILTSNNEQFLY